MNRRRGQALVAVALLGAAVATVLIVRGDGGGPDAHPGPERPTLAGYTVTYQVVVTIDWREQLTALKLRFPANITNAAMCLGVARSAYEAALRLRPREA